MSEPVVMLSALRARDEAGALHGLDLALPAGPVGVLLGSPSDGTTALASVLSGLLRPLGGTARVAGANPARSAALRARIGVLPGNPVLPRAGRVCDLLAAARVFRGGEAPRDQWYEWLGLDGLSKRKVASLNRWEQRSVALGLALAVPAPVLLVLHDPLGELVQVSAESLRSVLKARADAGTCVLLLTPSAHDAASLADDVATLESGRIGRAMGAPDVDEFAPGSVVELQVWCDMGRAFASALLLEPEVTGLSWGSSDTGTPLRVQGKDLQGCARAVARVAIEQGVRVDRVQPVVPSTPEINAATAGLALAARQQAAFAAQMKQGEGGS